MQKMLKMVNNRVELYSKQGFKVCLQKDVSAVRNMILKEKQNQTRRAVDQIPVSRDRRGVKHHGKHQGMIHTKAGMLWCTGRF